MASTQTDNETAWFLATSHPVLLPSHDALTASREDFEAFVVKELSRQRESDDKDEPMTEADKDATVVTSETSTDATLSPDASAQSGSGAMDVDVPSTEEEGTPSVATGNPFVDGLLASRATEKTAVSLGNTLSPTGAFTANGDLSHPSTNNPLVDLFSELDTISSSRSGLEPLLNRAWAEDPLMTVKIIFNARSIHLGKASRHAFYSSAGWLAQHHPLTLVGNLRWLSRPVIEKKIKKADGDEEEEFVVVDEEVDENDPLRFDVQHGVSHGYWKDLLNILAIAANGKLDGETNPTEVLNSENPGIFKGKSSKPKRGRARGRGGRRGGLRGGSHSAKSDESSDQTATEVPKSERGKVGDPKEAAKALRREARTTRHSNVLQLLEENAVYRCLHLAISRLFAEQLQADLKALRDVDTKAKRNVSLCAKWAPTDDHFHDRHTFVISSIAEAMYPRESFDNSLSATDDRETYIRYAREQYRKDTSALRKHLDIVERKLTEKKYEAIKYDRIPSIAMRNYSKIFIENDFERFEKYLDNVAQGKAKISGATLLPSTLVRAALADGSAAVPSDAQKATMSSADLIKYKVRQMELAVVDGQWKTLVQRIKDSGTLSSSIAVCDVSGSMYGPESRDSTRPIDSAVGLSLLIAETTAAPYNGIFITFHNRPRVEKVDLSATFSQKVSAMARADWGMNTNFTAVFEKLILPIAKENKVKAEDMVKRVFVFSDMQFDAAQTNRWSTSFERIKKLYDEAGYEVPELVFWNLNSRYAGKPVTVTDEGTALVTGYSQGMLKVFLEGGGFEEDKEEDKVIVTKNEDGTVTETVEKGKTDPLKTVKKAVGHQAYDMLQVLD